MAQKSNKRRAKYVGAAFVELETRDVPTFLGNQVFPLDNPWNQKITSAPVSSNSAAIMDYLVTTRGNPRLHPDFGNPNDGALYGIPITVVDSTVPKVPVIIPDDGYAEESDNVLVPIPANAVIEGDGPTGPASPDERGDSHVLIYDKSANILYETYLTARPNEATFPGGTLHPLGQWGAFQVSVWDLNTNDYRTLGFTSADAAGLPLMPGLVRPDEVLQGSGVIDHAIRFSVARTRREYTYPASHYASSLTATNLPRMGERFRLKSTFSIPSTWPNEVKAVAQAMKDYGMIVADNGSDMFFQGTPSTSWNMSGMLMLQSKIRASDFEVVELAPVVTSLSYNSGNFAGGAVMTITGQNFSGASGNLHVLFGGVPAKAFTVVSDTRIDVVTPAHAVGTVDVRVQSGSNQQDADGKTVFFGYGTSANTPADDYTFNTSPPPIGPPPPPIGPPPPPVGPPPPPVGPPPPYVPPPPPYVPPPPLPMNWSPFAVGGGSGGWVRILDANGLERQVLEPFPGYTGSVRTAVADFNADGTADFVVGTGPGRATQVRILDGIDQHELFALEPFEASFQGGVFVAAGDMNGDGRAELVVSPDEGGGPRVRVFDGNGYGQLADFLGIEDPAFRGGARVAVGDLDGDGEGDLIVAAGFGGGPRVAAFGGRSLAAGPSRLFADFLAFEPALRNGSYVAAGDLNGDGRAELVAGGGPGGAPRVSVFNSPDLLANTSTRMADFFAGDVANRDGVRLAVHDLNGDRRSDLITGLGGTARVTCYAGGTWTSPPSEWLAFDAFPVTRDGVYVG